MFKNNSVSYFFINQCNMKSIWPNSTAESFIQVSGSFNSGYFFLILNHRNIGIENFQCISKSLGIRYLLINFDENNFPRKKFSIIEKNKNFSIYNLERIITVNEESDRIIERTLEMINHFITMFYNEKFHIVCLDFWIVFIFSSYYS